MQTTPAATTRSPRQVLADLLLKRPVEEYIAERRAEGRSWAKVARDLYEATGGQVDVADETVRAWARHDSAA